jgi:hypothetical protein
MGLLHRSPSVLFGKHRLHLAPVTRSIGLHLPSFKTIALVDDKGVLVLHIQTFEEEGAAHVTLPMTMAWFRRPRIRREWDAWTRSLYKLHLYSGCLVRSQHKQLHDLAKYLIVVSNNDHMPLARHLFVLRAAGRTGLEPISLAWAVRYSEETGWGGARTSPPLPGAAADGVQVEGP